MRRQEPTRHAPVAIAVFLLAVAGNMATLYAQQTFSFFLSAVNSAGERIGDLRTEEVVVAEDGKSARIVKMTPINWPVKLTVMIDNGLETSSLLVQYRNGLKSLFAALPTGVEASLLTLAPQPRWVVRPTNDRFQLAKGVDQIAPDSSSSKFVDALIEAADRIDKENKKEVTYFPVIVMVATTNAEGSMPRDRDIDRMVRQFTTYPARIHIIMLGVNAVSNTQIIGARQVQVGKYLTDATGGRYEAIAAATRISSLLEEYGKMIADSHAFQSRQYLVTAERPAGASGKIGQLSMGLTRPGLTFDATAQGLKP